ncbi:hypothetical protein GZ998_12615 [Actinomyces sp. 594]|nr:MULTISPECIES: hypothetical protein [unclassified Actinomyces]MBW3070339.1 hypothetical protein [Actinomyces sp. 594]
MLFSGNATNGEEPAALPNARWQALARSQLCADGNPQTVVISLRTRSV